MKTVTSVTLVEDGSFMFHASFLYDGRELQTRAIERTATEEQVKAVIKEAVEAWEAQRADDNFQALQESFQDREISI